MNNDTKVRAGSACKPGIKTTEFWLSTFAMLLTAAYATGLIPTEGPWAKLGAFAATALTAAGYSVARGKAKAAVPILLACFGLALCSGCARFSTVQVDRTYGTNGEPARVIETRAGAYTLWAGDSALANWQATQTDKTQSAKVGTLNQRTEVLNTNSAAVVKAIGEGVVEGLKGGL